MYICMYLYIARGRQREGEGEREREREKWEQVVSRNTSTLKVNRLRTIE